MDLVLTLSSIRRTIVEDLVDDLATRWAKDSANSVVMVLDRVIADLKNDDQEDAFTRQLGELIRIGFNCDINVSAMNKRARLETISGQLREQSPPWFEPKGRADAAAQSETFSQIAKVASAALDVYEADVSALFPSAPATEKPSDDGGDWTAEEIERNLDDYLQQRYVDLPRPAISDFRIVPGGRAKLTALFTLAENRLTSRRLVLRRDVPHSHTATTVTNEFPLLQMLFEAGLPVPRPVFAEDDPSVLGGPFIIVEEIEDAIVAGAPFREDRRTALNPKLGVDIARILGQLHRFHALPPGVRPSQDAFGGMPLEDEIRGLEKRWRGFTHRPPFSLAIDMGFSWLKNNIPAHPRPRCIVHGDFGAHNILVRDGRLAALIDWELVHEGDPAEDISYCRHMLLDGLIDWEDFVDEYVRAGGDPHACERSAVNFYGVLAFLRHGVIAATMWDIVASGQRNDINAVSSALHFFNRIHQYEARELANAVR